MSNVKFLRGPQGNLDKLATFTEGAFYVTTDTDRMYFAQSANDLVYLNKHIINVPNINSLPNIGEVNAYDFYYAEAENVLCTKLPDATQWTQINKNTDTYQDTFIDNVDFEVNVDEDQNIVVSYTIQQKTTDQLGAQVTNSQKSKQFVNSFVISKNFIEQVQSNASVDVKATTVEGKTVVKTDGTGAAGSGFTIVGDNGINVAAADNQITISGQTYSLASNANTTNIVLKDKDGADINTVNFKAGNDDIVINGVNKDEISVAHKEYNANIGDLTNSDQVSENAPALNLISGISVENGHITNVETKKVTLTADKISRVFLDDDSHIVIAVNDAENKEKYSVTTEETFGYIANNGFVPVGSNLDTYYYTQAQVDNKFKAANALTFKGGVSTKSDSPDLNLPEENVSIGDVYIVEQVGTYGNNIVASVGDLFIAYSTTDEETNDGVIDKVNLKWTYVPSGNEKVYTYELSVDTANNQIVLRDNVNATNTIALNDDDVIIAVADGSNGNKINFSHAKIANPNNTTPTGTLSAGGTFDVVTNVAVDAYGHVSGKEITKFTMPSADKLVVENNSIILKNSENAQLGVAATFVEGNLTTPVVTDNKITFNHNEIDVVKDSGSAIKDLSNNVNFDVVESIERDASGHVTKITTKAITLTAVNQFLQETSVTNTDGVSTLAISSNVKNSEGADVKDAAHTITIKSESLQLTQAADGAINAEIVWGTF